jgi:hypothetical protein
MISLHHLRPLGSQLRCIERSLRVRCIARHEFHSSSTPRQSYSRMLDMGGAPSAATTKNTVRLRNASKNSKVQAVAFDFELLVRTMQEQQDTQETTTAPSSTTTISQKPLSASVTPHVDQIQQVAKLLKVELSDPDSSTSRKLGRSHEEDDLSALLAVDQENKTMSQSQSTTSTTSSAGQSSIPASLQDIRAKYANKLHSKGLEGGLATVELVKHQREEALKRGDAQGHWAARAIASSTSASQSGSRWMALTGTGKLLSTLTHRSMKIALLPRPVVQTGPLKDRSPEERMLDLTRQLRDVVFDVLVDLPTQSDSPVRTMVQSALHKLALEPKVILFVSDQDAFLKEAHDLGMITCRIRPLNARRGNVSCHYTVENVLEVLDVINELAGISFNTVLNM